MRSVNVTDEDSDKFKNKKYVPSVFFISRLKQKYNSMATITILIRHSGKWSEENFYVEYSIDGIVLKEYASYSDLVD
ncbi:hypothetical protein H5410_044147 [Solanum commersonii]|uniref:Uncharacterized protein n=1 Tax=Solanum commersonii TaxID=4109 RepID=A0A9J5X5Z3_SOLCO|nr:hypothetical protein H5410_044147 [Solanum commersonii]